MRGLNKVPSLEQMSEKEMLASLKLLLDLGYLDSTVDVCGNGEYTHHIISKGFFLHTLDNLDDFFHVESAKSLLCPHPEFVSGLVGTEFLVGGESA